MTVRVQKYNNWIIQNIFITVIMAVTIIMDKLHKYCCGRSLFFNLSVITHNYVMIYGDKIM